MVTKQRVWIIKTLTVLKNKYYSYCYYYDDDFYYCSCLNQVNKSLIQLRLSYI